MMPEPNPEWRRLVPCGTPHPLWLKLEGAERGIRMAMKPQVVPERRKCWLLACRHGRFVHAPNTLFDGISALWSAASHTA